MATITTNIPISREAIKVDGEIVSADYSGGWKQVLAAYLAEKDVKETSRKSYKKALSQFFRWIDREGKDLGRLRTIDILEWKDYLKDTKHSVRTISLYIISVKGFYNWTETTPIYGKDGNIIRPMIYPDIAKRVRSTFGRELKRNSDKEQHFVKMHLTDKQGAALLDYFKQKPLNLTKSGETNPFEYNEKLRDFALINLLIRTGLRSVEVSRADIGDIKEINERKVLYVQGKGKSDKCDFVVLSEKVLGPLNEYLATKPDAASESPLFTCEGRSSRGRRLSTRAIQYIGKEGLRAIGLDDHRYSLHSLRHTAGVQILKHGGTQFDVQDVLRHASPSTSQIYLESIKEERRIEAAPEFLLDNSFE